MYVYKFLNEDSNLLNIGHPSGERYNSAISFKKHLEWLVKKDIDSETNEACLCILCNKGKAIVRQKPLRSGAKRPCVEITGGGPSGVISPKKSPEPDSSTNGDVVMTVLSKEGTDTVV